MLLNPEFKEEGFAKVALVILPDNSTETRSIGNIFAPVGWRVWFQHIPGEWDQPEAGDARTEDRLWNGHKTYKIFSFFRRHRAGLFQDVNVIPGHRYRLSAAAHAWSNHQDPNLYWCWNCGAKVEIPENTDNAPCQVCGTGINRDCHIVFQHPDDSRWSEGPGYDSGYITPALGEGAPTPAGPGTLDDWRNMAFRVGVNQSSDPNPLSNSTVFAPAAHVYNQFRWLPSLEFTAQTDKVRIVLLGRAIFPFKHCDQYWGEAKLEDITETVPPPTDPEYPSQDDNKIGPHVIRNSGNLGQWISSKPAVIKLVGDWSLATQVPKETLVIGRKHDEWNPVGCFNSGKTPQQGASEFMDTQLSTIIANPSILYWEGPNEPVWTSADGMSWYAQFEIERMKQLANIGKFAVIGNFSSGAPEVDPSAPGGELWTPFIPACKAGIEYKAILGLHEYSCPWMWWMTGKYQRNPNEDQGDEGWTTLRYRKVYRQYLIPNECALPLVVTECGIDPLVQPQPVGTPTGAWSQLTSWWESNGYPDYAKQLIWYNHELQKDTYVIGCTVFCEGHFDQRWAEFDIAGTQVETDLITYTNQYSASVTWNWNNYVQQSVPEPPEVICDAHARVPYVRKYVLLSPLATFSYWQHAGMGASTQSFTVGGSADDAGVGCGLGERVVIAVNPQEWRDSLPNFFNTYYPGVTYQSIEPKTPAELVLMLQPLGSPNLSQRDSRWANEDLGEEPGGATIGEQGCLVTSAAWILSKTSNYAITPKLMNEVFNAAGTPFTSDHILSNWASAVALFPTYWDKSMKSDTTYTVDQINTLINSGWQLILRTGYDPNTHFVGLDSINQDGTLRVMDVWYGQFMNWPISKVTGVRGAHMTHAPEIPVPPDAFTLRGIHDAAGATWMANNNLQGWCCDPVWLGLSPQPLDYTAYANKNIRVIARLNRGWATSDGGEGTIAEPENMDQFVNAVVDTILNIKGAYAVILCNEMNNAREWPAGVNVTPDYYVSFYNAVWARVQSARQSGLLIGAGAIDPTNAGWGDWRETWPYVLNKISGCDIIPIHAYTHGPGLELLTDNKVFGPPLAGVHFNYRMMDDVIAAIPYKYRNLPVVMTETNHLFTTNSDAGEIGWLDSESWLLAAYSEVKQRNISGMCVYRWSQDQWAVNNKPNVLSAIRKIE